MKTREKLRPTQRRYQKVSKAMFGFHEWDLLVVLLIILLFFGARRLPEFGSALGQSFKMLQKGLSGSEERSTEEQQAGEPTPPTTTTKESDR